MQSNVETITPEMARGLLKFNKKNRRVNAATVKNYAAQITKGQWKLNGESIKLSTTGELLDGQHRMEAVVLADKAVKMLVVRNLENEAIKTIDSGKPRSHADVLKIHGFESTNLSALATAVRLINDFSSGEYVEKKDRLSATDIIQFLEQHPKIFASNEYINTLNIMAPLSIAVAMHYLFCEENYDKTEKFFSLLNSGANLAENSPVLALRNKLTAMKMQGNKGNRGRKMYMAFMILAFRAYLHNQEISFGSFQYKDAVKLDLKKGIKGKKEQ